MAVELSALRTGRALILRNVFVSVSDTHYCKRPSKLQELMRPEELGKLLKIMLLHGLEPVTFRFVVNRYAIAFRHENIKRTI
jgi:hypothetical protein